MKKKNKILRAWGYVIGGSFVAFGAMWGAIEMFFSSTFLPGNHIARYSLYGILAVVVLVGILFQQEGLSYIIYRIKRRNRRRRK